MPSWPGPTEQTVQLRTMFNPEREVMMFKFASPQPHAIDPRLEAESIPPHLAYLVALRVLNHAATGKYRDVPTSQIPALEALEHWQATRVESRPAAGSQPATPAWDRDNVSEISDPPSGALVPRRPAGVP